MNLKEWYTSQSQREQLIVAATAVVAIAALIYALAYKPLSTGLSARSSSIAAKERDLNWMQQQIPLIKRPGGGSKIKDTNKEPYILLDEAIKKAGISPPRSFTPDGSQGARAQFDEVDFNKLLQVLGTLEQDYGIAVKTINLSAKKPGLVGARMSLEKGL